ncbi:MAG: response regulator transcription factor [Lachnospiraceae bacterium]|nr:response regulator transcription factor [Lachnospiraceae bacterium]
MDKLLLIEDDMPLAMATSFAIETEGFQVTHVATLKDAKEQLNKGEFSLVLLDVNLPDGDGYTFCKNVRAEGYTFPIIFLTALDQEVNVIQGLEVGGDDYVTKPFRVRELISRIKANIRRNQVNNTNGEVMTFGAFRIDLAGHKVTKDGAIINLTPSEFRLFTTLIKNKNQTLTRSALLEQLWDIDGDFVDDNTLSVYIKRLREKLGNEKDYISTIRGVGYMISDK